MGEHDERASGPSGSDGDTGDAGDTPATTGVPAAGDGPPHAAAPSTADGPASPDTGEASPGTDGTAPATSSAGSSTSPSDDPTVTVPRPSRPDPAGDVTERVTVGAGTPPYAHPGPGPSAPQGPYPPPRGAYPPHGPHPPQGPYPPPQGPGGTAVHGPPTAYGPGPYGPYGPPGPTPPVRRNNRTPLVIVGAVVVLALIAGAVFLLIPPSPTTAVADAAQDARGWAGTTYRGPVRGPGGDPITVDVTVGPNGDKAGTFTRSGGGRAEFAEVGGVQVLRGNAAWWAGTPQGAERARRLAGVWLRNPAPETTWLAALPLLAPSALADDLAGTGTPPEYTDAGDQPVGDEDGRVVTAGERRVVVSDARDARLLALVPPEAVDPTGLRVGAADPAGIAAVGSAGSALSRAEDYTATLYSPDDVTLVLVPAPPCTTPTCTRTVTLTNGSELEARGTVTISKNGTVINRAPFRIAPRGSATVTATTPNAGMAAGRDVTACYEARITAD